MSHESAACRATMVVPDATAACSYLENLLGAQPVVEPERALALNGGGSLQAVGLGDMVLEFVEPRGEGGAWSARLDTVGPSVVSLAIDVDDLARGRSTLEGSGISSYVTAEGRVLGDSMSRLGFDVELIARHPRDTAAGRAGRWGRVSPMLHVEITHDDISAARSRLARLFGSQPIETQFSDFLMRASGGRMDICHVNLGDAIVLQYIEPRPEAGPWWTQLAQRGPSVHNITWLVEDMPAVAAASAAAGTRDLRYFEFNYDPLFGAENRIGDKTIGRIIDAAAIVGFHIELSEPQATNIDKFFFKAMAPY